MQINTVTSSL